MDNKLIPQALMCINVTYDQRCKLWDLIKHNPDLYIEDSKSWDRSAEETIKDIAIWPHISIDEYLNIVTVSHCVFFEPTLIEPLGKLDQIDFSELIQLLESKPVAVSL